MTAKWKKLIAILCMGALMFQGTLAAAQSDQPEEAPAETAQEAADPTEESLQEEDIPQVPEEEPESEPEEIPEGENTENQGETAAEAAEMPAETAEASAETAEMPAEMAEMPEEMAEASAEEAAAETAETPAAEDAEAAEIPAETEEATPENMVEAEVEAEAETEAPAEASVEETAPAEESEAEEDVAEAAAAGTSDTAGEEAAAETPIAEEAEAAGMPAEGESDEAAAENSGEEPTDPEEGDSNESNDPESAEENEQDGAEEAEELSETVEPDETQVGEGTVQCAVTAEQPFILRFVPEKTEELQIRLKADSAFRLSMREESSDLTSDTESNEDHEILMNRNVRQGTALLLELNTDLSTTITIIFAAEDENAADETEPAAESAEEQAPAEEAAEQEPEETAEELSEEETEEPAADTTETEADDGEPEAVTEVIITKAVKTGDVWEGAASAAKPAVLKLDVEQHENVFIILESAQILWATVEKTDRPEEDPAKSYSDQMSGQLVISLAAEQGSYLIKAAPESPGYAQFTVRFLDHEAYIGWTEAQETKEGTEHPTEREQSAESEKTDADPEFKLPENRSVYISMTLDTEEPQIGDIIHFGSVITGYDDLSYTLQWQTSPDQEIWTDYVGATEPELDVELTEKISGIYFRLVLYVETEQQTE